MLTLNGLVLSDAFLRSDIAESSNHPSGTVNVPKSLSPPACKRERPKAVLVAGAARVLTLSHRWQVPQEMLHEDALSRQKWESNHNFMMCWAPLGICQADPDCATSMLLPFSSTACLMSPHLLSSGKEMAFTSLVRHLLGLTSLCTQELAGSTPGSRMMLLLSLCWQAIASLAFPLYQTFLLPLSLSGRAEKTHIYPSLAQ